MSQPLIVRDYELPLSKQAAVLGISRGTLDPYPRPFRWPPTPGAILVLLVALVLVAQLFGGFVPTPGCDALDRTKSKV